MKIQIEAQVDHLRITAPTKYFSELYSYSIAEKRAAFFTPDKWIETRGYNKSEGLQIIGMLLDIADRDFSNAYEFARELSSKLAVESGTFSKESFYVHDQNA